MDKPKIKPTKRKASTVRPGAHRLQVGDAFHMVQGISFEGDLEGTRDVEICVIRWTENGEWKRGEFRYDEIVTTIPRSLFKVPLHKLGDLKNKVDKLNKRAKRRNLEPIYFEEIEQVEEKLYHYRYDSDATPISEERYLKYKDRSPIGSDYWEEIRAFMMVKIVGETPHFNGWRAIAVLEHLPAGTLIHAIGEHEIPERYREPDNFCDHCKAKRQRKKTLVIQHENGETKRIGLNCAKDFVDVKSASQLVGNAELWASFFSFFGDCEEGGWKVREPQEFGTVSYLCWAAQSIRQQGWLPRSRSEEGTPTADDALWLMLPRDGEKKEEKDEREKRGSPVELDFQRAEKALEWARTLVDKSDFGHNIRVLAEPEWFPKKKAGYVAFFVQGYLRHLANLEKYRQEKREADENPSEWVGEPDDKVEMNVTCVEIRTIRGEQWDSFMYKFLDGEGNRLVWFTSTSFSLQEWVAEGRSYLIRGRVKSHDEYKGVKATKLTRVTFPEVKKVRKSGMTPEEFLNERKSA